MRAQQLIWLGLVLGCQRAPGSASAPASASAAEASSARGTGSPSGVDVGHPAGASCEQLRKDIRREQARLAKLPQRCDSDADCALYGGHECPNALVRICPDAVAKSSATALQPLEDAYQSADCGPILWSPYYREAACEAGVCVGR